MAASPRPNTRRHGILRSLVVVVALLLTVSGCRLIDPATTPTTPVDLATVTAAQQAWSKGLKGDWAARVRVRCFCAHELWIVKLRDGRVGSGVRWDTSPTDLTRDDDPFHGPLAALEKVAADLRNGGSVWMSAPGPVGNGLVISSDPQPNSIDDEYTIIIDGLTRVKP